MARNSKLQAKDLVGLSLYHDPKYGTVYYDMFTKRAFQLINQDVKNYNVYTAMLPLCAVASYLCNLWFKVPPMYCLVIFVVLWIISEVVARIVFFYKLPEVRNWKKVHKDNIIESMAKNYTGLRLAILTFLLITVSVVMVINAKYEHFEGANLYGSYIVSAGAALFAIVSIIAFITKKVKKYPNIIRK